MNNLKDLRTKAGLNQFQLSKRSGVSRWKLSMAENHQLALKPEDEVAVLQAVQAAFRRNAEEFSTLFPQPQEAAR